MTIINDILDFSKIEAGQPATGAAAFDLIVAVEEVGELLVGRGSGEGTRSHRPGRPAVPGIVVGDPGRVRQILINLVGNAVKFTAKGHVLVTWSATRRRGRTRCSASSRTPASAFRRIAWRTSSRRSPRSMLLDAPVRRHRPGARHQPRAGDVMGGTRASRAVRARARRSRSRCGSRLPRKGPACPRPRRSCRASAADRGRQ